MTEAQASSRMWRQPDERLRADEVREQLTRPGQDPRRREEGIVLPGEDHDRRREAGQLLDRRVARHLGVEARPAEGELGRLHDERIRVRPGEPLDGGFNETRPPDCEEGDVARGERKHRTKRNVHNPGRHHERRPPDPRRPKRREAQQDARAVRDGDECGRLEPEAIEDLLAPLAEPRIVRRHAAAGALSRLSDRVRRVDAELARERGQPRQRERVDDVATLERENRRRTLGPSDENVRRPERRLNSPRLRRERQSRKRTVVERLDRSACGVGLVDRVWFHTIPQWRLTAPHERG